MAMSEATAGWTRTHPPVFLWGAVVLSPAVMGLAGEGPPSRLALAAVAVVLALGFLEIVPRRGRVASVLVALLYVMLASALAGSPPDALTIVYTSATLVSGALCASICVGLARVGILNRIWPFVTFLGTAVYFFGMALGPGFENLETLWPRLLPQSLCLAGVAALVHVQMLGVARAAGQAKGRGIWAAEVIALLAGSGLMLLLAAVAEGWAEPLGFAAALLLTATALRRDIGPRTIAVAAALYFAAHAAPFADLTFAHSLSFLALICLALAPLRRLAQEGVIETEEPLWFTALQPAAEAWMVTFDLDRDEVILGPAAAAHFGRKPRLGSWLEDLSVEEGEALLSLLRDKSSKPVTITLRGAGSRSAPSPYSVHLLERDGPRTRVVLRRLEAEAALNAKLNALQGEVDRMRLREERLLALASHELRTPVATLSMLAEEIDEGGSWEKLGPDVHAVIGQVLAVLDDLRAGGRSEGALARAGEITPAQVAARLREEFGRLAETLGVELVLEIPSGAGTRYRCEAGRLLLVLEKLLRHLLSLSDLRGLRVALVVMPQGGDRFTFVWTLIPQAGSPLAMPEPGLFEPFATGPDAGLGSRLQGAGLYTADKAAIAMGGTLKLQSDPAGFLFVFTHPVRRSAELRPAGRG